MLPFDAASSQPTRSGSRAHTWGALLTAVLLAACSADATRLLQPDSTTAAAHRKKPASDTAIVVSSTNALAGATFWVDPFSNAKLTADSWRSTRPADAAAMDKIAAQPEARWFGNWNADIYTDVSSAVTTMSAAGAWPLPDRQAARYHMLSDAVHALKSAGGLVYIDAGNAHWVSSDVMASRLRQAGIDAADGFALNVSNYFSTSDNVRFGNDLSRRVGGKHYVIDTSRNGMGGGNGWCNPSGQALGAAPTTNTGVPLADAFLWVKHPGESDGTCNGGPKAGAWWPEYALGLAQRQFGAAN